MEAAIRTAGTKLNLQVGTIESYTKSLDKSEASILASYFIETNRGIYAKAAPIVFPVEHGVARYQFAGVEYNQDAKPSLQSFMSPLVKQAFAPDCCKANDERSIEGRVTSVAARDISPSKFLVDMINDFCDLVIPSYDVHKLAPVDLEEVFRRQDKETQGRILREADLAGPEYSTTVKAFMKKEAGGKAGDPRNISTINGVDKRNYSTYMYAFSDRFMKGTKWYAFGKAPRTIAQRVADICSGSSQVFLGDLSRMDGRVSRLMRLLERAILLRAFKPEYHLDLERLHESQMNRKVCTSFGVWFNSLMSRLSGSPETADLNTLQNLFLCYLGYRCEIRDGRYFTHAEAVDAVDRYVMVGGDDSIVGQMSESAYKKAASHTGHLATGETFKRGSDGINFLARYYSPEVWNGCLDSMCDLERTISKFHTCTNLATYTVRDKLVEKSLSFLSNDRNTPVLGEYCKKVVELLGSKTKSTGDEYYWSNNDASKCYPNDFGCWMVRYTIKFLPHYDIVSFGAWLGKVGIGGIMTPPCFNADPIVTPTKPSSIPLVVNGEQVGPITVPVVLTKAQEVERDDPRFTAVTLKTVYDSPDAVLALRELEIGHVEWNRFCANLSAVEDDGSGVAPPVCKPFKLRLPRDTSKFPPKEVKIVEKIFGTLEPGYAPGYLVRQKQENVLIIKTKLGSYARFYDPVKNEASLDFKPAKREEKSSKASRGRKRG
jgi:hypothetical protein